MRLFARYLFWQAAGALTLILLSLTGVVWIATALKQLNVVTGEGQAALEFIKMTLLAIPNLMAIISLPDVSFNTSGSGGGDGGRRRRRG